MCRITGFWDFNFKNDYNLENVLTLMRDSLRHGGPDDAGNYVEIEKGLGLANRRLAILDLSPLGHQPMADAQNEIVVVFNGEIYNFQEIKAELQINGYKFKSNSDTEVLIYAYKRWGLNCLSKLRGMFAIVFWDKKREKLILIRDRMGVKPLYYYHKEGLFMFASEPRAFLCHPKFKKNLSKEGLFLFFRYGYIFYPYSIWENVYKLEPGTYLVIDKNQKIVKGKYWDLESIYEKYFKIKDKKFNEIELIDQLEKIFIDSFKLRLVSDVSVGVFLSGGIDSTTLTTILQKNLNQKLKTFTVGFYENEYDESKWAKKIAQYLGTEHNEFFCSIEEALSIIPYLAEIYDEPFGDSSAVPTHLISKIAREKVKVILSGDGGDEFFGGYDRYWVYKFILENKMFFNNKFKSLFKFILEAKREPAERIKKFLKLLENVPTKIKLSLVTSHFLDDYYNLLSEEFLIKDEICFRFDNQKMENLSPVIQIMLLDAKYYLSEDILTKVDRASMHVALEAREPLLDQKIIDFIAPLPIEFKIRRNKGKYLMRKLLEKNLPKNLWQRPKHGFAIPQEEWLRKKIDKMVKSYLSVEKINKYKILNSEHVNNILDRFYKRNEKGLSNKIWLLFIFQLWAERWLG